MRKDWFTRARFGMFVHFGLYSAAARQERLQGIERLTDRQYRQYFDHFGPDLFDADAIAATASRAGMGYMVFTTKHHEGFCLWDSAQTDFTSKAAVGRDFIREYVDAARAHGLKVGFYHSLIDWHHPDFTVDANHPRRDDPGAESLNLGRDMARYRRYLHAQVRELLTKYGEIDYMYFDFTYPEHNDGWEGKGPDAWAATELLALCRQLQPDMLVNDRLGIPADVVTLEQYQPTATIFFDGMAQTWEASHTLNGSWGYDRENQNHKSAEMLVQMLIESVSMDGNTLLNVGPDGRGAIAPRDADTFDQIAEWMRLHRDAVVGAGQVALIPPRVGVYTGRGDRLYLSLFAWPLGSVHLPDLAGKVAAARLLNDGSWLDTSVSDLDPWAAHTGPAGEAPGTLTVHLPARRPDVLVPVIELKLKGPMTRRGLRR